MYHDQEINAMSNVYEAVKGLNNPQIKRIIDWVSSKFCLDNSTGFKNGESEAGRSQQPQQLETAGTTGKQAKKTHKVQPGNAQSTFNKPGVGSVNSTGIYSFMNYDTFKDLVYSSDARTIAARILLASAYLHEKENLNEFTTNDINILLKKIGQGFNNISASISSLMTRKRPLLVQSGKLGTGKRSKRTFRLTEEGLRLARSYLKV